MNSRHRYLRRLGIALAVGVGVWIGGCQAPRGYRRVAVPDFENSLPEERYAHLSATLAEQMSIALRENPRQYPRVVVVERQEFRRTSALGRVTDLFQMSRSGLKQVGRRVGADYLVIGSVTPLEGDFVLSVYLYSVATGEPVPGTTFTNFAQREGDLYPCLQFLADQISYQVSRFDERERIAEAYRFSPPDEPLPREGTPEAPPPAPATLSP